MSARRTAGLALLFAALAVPRTTAAGDAVTRDYGVNSQEWNGLSYLFETAAEAHVDLVPLEEVDWDTVRPDDVLLLLYPTRPPDVDNVLRFLADGGRVVLADDFGAGAPLLAAVGLRREDAPADHHNFRNDLVSFPVFFAPRDAAPHFLFFNTSQIIANHPTAVVADDPTRVHTIVPYEGASGAALVAEASVGRGRLVAVADASLFINDMLRNVHGDKQLVANVLRYNCGPDECRVGLVLPWARWRGEYRAAPDVHDVESFLRCAVEAVNAAIVEANAALREGGGTWLFGLVSAAAVFLALVGGGVLRRRTPFSGFRAEALPTLSPMALRVRTLSESRRADFSEPLALLRRRLERRAGSGPGGARAAALVARLGPAGASVAKGRLVTVSPGRFLSWYDQARQTEEDRE